MFHILFSVLGMSEVGFISMPPYPKDRPDSCGTISPGAERKASKIK